MNAILRQAIKDYFAKDIDLYGLLAAFLNENPHCTVNSLARALERFRELYPELCE